MYDYAQRPPGGVTGGMSTFASRYERENSPYKYRKSSPISVGTTIAESRFMADKMRHSQYVSRYSLPPLPEHPVVIERRVPRLSTHQDYYLTELTAEVNELKSKQKDYQALQEQFRYLQDQYKQVQFEKQQFESDCLNKISQDRQETDILIRELDQLTAENLGVEQE